jgi:hypothetical protein
MNYTLRIEGPEIEDSTHPANEAVDVYVTIGDKTFTSSAVTTNYLRYVTKKNERTGENNGGEHFEMPGMFVVRNVEEGLIRRTVDSYFTDNVFKTYFRPIEL